MYHTSDIPYALLVKSDRLNWIWFQPSSSLIGMVQMKGFTLVVDCKVASYTLSTWWLSKIAITGLGCPDLIVGSPESPPDILIIKNLYLKAEVLLQILDDHDQKWQLDAQGLGGVSWTGDVGRADVATHDLQDARLDVAVGNALDVPISDCM